MRTAALTRGQRLLTFLSQMRHLFDGGAYSSKNGSSIPPLYHHPPGANPPGKVRPFGPGGGELFETVLSRGYRGGENLKYLSLFLLSTPLLALPSAEQIAKFLVTICRICNLLVRQE